MANGEKAHFSSTMHAKTAQKEFYMSPSHAWKSATKRFFFSAVQKKTGRLRHILPSHSCNSNHIGAQYDWGARCKERKGDKKNKKKRMRTRKAERLREKERDWKSEIAESRSIITAVFLHQIVWEYWRVWRSDTASYCPLFHNNMERISHRICIKISV